MDNSYGHIRVSTKEQNEKKTASCLEYASFVAKHKRANIQQRQAEGITASKEMGVCFGKPSKPLSENFYMCIKIE